MNFRFKAQIAEVLGHVNRWYCSNFYCTCVDDPDKLAEYFVRTGGAEDFARRYREAMGEVNRWYCSQFHRHDVRDEQMLWEYYLRHSRSDRNCG